MRGGDERSIRMDKVLPLRRCTETIVWRKSAVAKEELCKCEKLAQEGKKTGANEMEKHAYSCKISSLSLLASPLGVVTANSP